MPQHIDTPEDDPEPDPTAPLHLRIEWRDRDLNRRKAAAQLKRQERIAAYRAQKEANAGPSLDPAATFLPAPSTGPKPQPQPDDGTDGTSQPAPATPPPPLADDTPLTPDDYRRAIARIVRTPGVKAADCLKALELDAKLTARMGSVIDDSREKSTIPEPGSPEWSGNLQMIMQAQQSQIARAVREARERRGDIASPPPE